MKGFDACEQTALKRAKKRVAELKGFYWHLVVFIIFNSFNFLNYFLVSKWSERVELWVVMLICFAWGVGLVLHAMQVFGMHYLLGADWEKRKIEEFMKDDTL